MKRETFEELLASAEEARDHAAGKRNLKTTTVPLPPRAMTAGGVKRVRHRMRASQAVFASYLNVSTRLVQAWEAGRRIPEGPALVLLHLAARQPELLETIREKLPAHPTLPRAAVSDRARTTVSACSYHPPRAGRRARL
ncbi:MAG: helix-turn-helix domain-containing protein [Bacteroidales bacterium]